MVCILCGSDTKVTNSRWQKRSNQVWRRRACLHCQAVFTTLEAADWEHAVTVKSPQGHYTPFLRDKLFLSLHRSLQHRPTALTDATELTNTVLQRLHAHIVNGALDSRHIATVSQVALNRFDAAASVHYRAFHGTGTIDYR